MTKPDVLRELLKVALHAHLDPSLLPYGDPITVSMWCTAGFTEQAATLIDTWPAEWLESELFPRFEETKQKYASFRSLTWIGVRDMILRFAQQVRLDKQDAMSLTPPIRSAALVFRQFFMTSEVVAIDDARILIEEALLRKDWRKIPQADVRTIVDRISAQPEERRFYFGNGHVFGMPAQLLADMPVKQRESFLRSLLAPLSNTAMILIEMIQKKSSTILQANIQRFVYQNRAFLTVLQKCLVNRAANRILRLVTPGPVFEKLASRSLIQTSEDLWLVLDGLCTQAWATFSRILAPDFKPPTSDPQTEASRRALARNVLAGHADGIAFIASLKEDCQRNLRVIRELVSQIEDYFPKDLLMVVDARSVFESPQLRAHFLHSLGLLERSEPSPN